MALRSVTLSQVPQIAVQRRIKLQRLIDRPRLAV